MKRMTAAVVFGGVILFIGLSFHMAMGGNFERKKDLIAPLVDSPAKTVGSDFNGDGIHDLVMGVHNQDDCAAGNDCGATYILYGASSFSQTYRLDGAGVNVTILGKGVSDQLGLSSASAGDLT
ncbi:MAG: hypothetical protein AAB309_03535 [Deltaproteobacteria bacterium]